MPPIIRDANIDDKSRCLALLEALGAATASTSEAVVATSFEALLSKERGQIVVAQHNNQLVGLASVSYNLALRYSSEYCQLEELIVDPAARGLNIGGLLVQETIRNATDRGCNEYGLYLLESTEHNRPFYEKHGFLGVGTEMRQRLPPSDRT